MVKVYEGKAKEGIAFLLAPRVWKSVIRYGCVNSRTVWIYCKISDDTYVLCVYASVSTKTKIGTAEMKKNLGAII